jgi:hypothetical protein
LGLVDDKWDARVRIWIPFHERGFEEREEERVRSEDGKVIVVGVSRKEWREVWDLGWRENLKEMVRVWWSCHHRRTWKSRL